MREWKNAARIDEYKEGRFEVIFRIIGYTALVFALLFGMWKCSEYQDKQTAEKHALFMKDCLAQGIKEFQCGHMWRLEQDARAAKNNSAAAMGFAAGAAGAAMGGKR